jgi:hypothetical protein
MWLRGAPLGLRATSRRPNHAPFPQSPPNQIGKYLFHRLVIEVHARLYCLKVCLSFPACKVAKIQWGKTCLGRHDNGQHSCKAAVSLPEGMNQNQFRVNHSEGMDHLGLRLEG